MKCARRAASCSRAAAIRTTSRGARRRLPTRRRDASTGRRRRARIPATASVIGEAIGAHFDDSLETPAAWAPVSLVPKGKGKPEAAFPHLIERAKPGVIAVTRGGKRFVNEASSYHDFMSALIGTTPAGDEVCAWLVCDHRFQRRYGLGFSKPFPFPIATLSTLWLSEAGQQLHELAAQCGIDPQGLVETVAAYNGYAKDGFDPQFHKGSTPYNRVQGDARHTPNPCLAPIVEGPFYAVKLLPGSLGTFAGLATDAALARARPDGRRRFAASTRSATTRPA